VRIDERGAIPPYYTPDMKPIADLHYSAQPAAMMWFLAEMAGVTGDARYRHCLQDGERATGQRCLGHHHCTDDELGQHCRRDGIR